MTAKEAAAARGVCHRAATLWAQRNGVQFYGDRTTPRARMIRGLWASGKFTKVEIARLMDCSRENVRQVIRYGGEKA